MFFAPRLAVAGLALGLSGLLVAPVQAASMAEYFNDYGETNIAVDGLNGGSGWDGAWADTNPADGPDYLAGLGLTSSVTGYENTGNLTGEGHGLMSQASPDTERYLNRFAYRETGGLTGTIWVSALFEVGTLARGIRFGFDSDGTSPANYVHVQIGNANSGEGVPMAASFNGVREEIGQGDGNVNRLPGNTTLILMVRIGINEDGDNDTFDVWIGPTDVSSPEALGPAQFSFSGSDAFGDSLDFFSVNINSQATGTPPSIISNSRVDAIRLSDDDHAFEFVTTGVPEPASAMLLGAGVLVLSLRRR